MANVADNPLKGLSMGVPEGIPDLGTEARWGTHIPAMFLAVELLPGRVLELGIGYFSTSILHNLRPGYLLSVESSPGWITRFINLQDERHKFRHVVDYDKMFSTIGLNWDVVLADHRPYQQRYKDIARLKGHSRIFVVHDTDEGSVKDFMTEEEIEDARRLLNSFKYRIDFKHILPYTSVLSDEIDIGRLILNGILMKG